MKKTVFVFTLLILFCCKLFSQTPPAGQLTPGGLFDKVSDRLGYSYNLSDLVLDDPGVNNLVPTLSCTAGYFRLFFDAGSVFSNTLAAAALCNLLTDVSGFINSPLSASGNTNYINIFCTNNPTISLAAGTPYFTYLSNPGNPNQGVLDNTVYKYIISGTDPYSDLPMGLSVGWVFYHARIDVNPSPLGTWNFTGGTISPGEIDFYSVMLHEVTHLLGFYSLIDSNGDSRFGTLNNYFSRFDKFLTTASGAPLLSNGTASCTNSNLTFVASTSVLATATTGCVNDITPTCSLAPKYSGTSYTAALYTPNCFELGSSLSHFEDMCPFSSTLGCVTGVSSSTNNNLYYVMSNAGGSGSCSVKRFLRPEEKSVLCDLGYTVNPVFVSSAAGGTYTYGISPCNGPGAWGLNDGINNGVFTFTTLTSISSSLNISITNSITNNDAPGVSVSCLELVYGSATFTNTGSSITVSVAAGFSGMVVLKYLPEIGNSYGSITYIFCYFISADCNPPNMCNLIQNGGFENVIPGYQACGEVKPGAPAAVCRLNCFTDHTYSPDLYARNCFTNTTSVPAELGVNSPDSYNGAPNNAILRFYATTPNTNFPNPYTESITNFLSADLAVGSAYQLSFLVNNASPKPVVISVASNSVAAFVSSGLFPVNLNVISSFTIPVTTFTPGWTTITHTFTFSAPSGTQSHPVIVIGIDYAKTTAMNSSTFSVFIDELSILPIGSATFVLPGSNNCSSITSYSNLADFASPVPGTFSGPGVTQANGIYSFNDPPSLPAGYYPVAFNYTAGACEVSVPQLIYIPGISIGPCSASRTLTATYFPPGTTCSWSPMGITTPTAVISSTSSAQTVTLTTTTGTCQSTYTIFVTPCCTQTITSHVGSVLIGTHSTPLVFNNDVTIPSGSTVTLNNTEFLFNPNTKITVCNAAKLIINGSHLYGCLQEMWRGIEVLDGGKVGGSYGLIEDAENAINLSNNTGIGNPILEISSTVFNKNYIDLNISNTFTTANIGFVMDNCVFTCRDLPFTSTTWPSAQATSSVSTSSAHLRYAFPATPTTGLAPPYLNQSTFTITTLKSPHTGERSNIAIYLNNVGVSTGITIGDISAASNFNLFDAHYSFIYSKNGSLNSFNNVFQNTAGSNMTDPENPTAKIPAAAIVHKITNTLNAELNLSGDDFSTGNKFWNCHRAVMANNTYSINIDKSILRSTQSTTNAGVMGQGNTGLDLRTNRFDYYIHDNEFTNVNNAINMSIASGLYDATYIGPGWTTTGVYARRVRIVTNSLSSGTITNAYMNNAINITGVNSTPWYVPSSTVSPYDKALVVISNTISNVFRGISVNGVHGFPVEIEDNKISLKEDNTFSLAQKGIALLSSNPTSSLSLGMNIISGNTASYVATPTQTLTQSALIFCEETGPGILSPSVTCNTLKQGYQGFSFTGDNQGAIWAVNEMELPMKRGMVLQNSGVISEQGGINKAIANQWTGGTWNGSNYHTWTSNSSAGLSVLWVRNTTGFKPDNSDGIPSNVSYTIAGTYNFINALDGGDYNCSDFPNHKIIYAPNEIDYSSADQYYMAKKALYDFLSFNDSILGSGDGPMNDFYTGQSGSSIEKIRQVEQYFYVGDIDPGLDLLSQITPENTIEFNYQSFYALYAKYAKTDFERTTAEDSAALRDLALLCPGTNGMCIYQAIALFNRVYNIILVPDCSADEGGEGARMANIVKPFTDLNFKSAWQLSLYPNPARHELSIHSNGKESEELNVLIFDLSGRQVLSETIKTKNFMSKLDLNLANGAYIISISNLNHESITKKLIISK